MPAPYYTNMIDYRYNAQYIDIQGINMLAIPSCHQESQQVTPDPQGQCICRGTGFAVLEISGSVRVASMGGGNAYIIDADRVQANGQGEWLEQDGWTVLLGWQGELFVDGNQYQIQLARHALNFEAKGRGNLRIRGTGYCTVNNQTFPLTQVFQEIEIS